MVMSAVDRTQTHVISCIYHIASSMDADPWPIVIEDYDGNTNSVILKVRDKSMRGMLRLTINSKRFE
jgi:hypothetical protein